MKRNKHSLSHTKLLTCNMGELIPVGVYETLPGDAIRQSTSLLVRVAPLVAPVMHPVTVRIHHWFVPFRLIWEDWEDFITGGADGLNASVPPTITANFAAGGLGDYFGVPPGVANVEASALPFRAYNLIFNENYRDADLVTERTVPVASGADATSPVTVASVAWEKDYFTSARPWAQKGAEVTMPLGTTAPVKTDVNDVVTGAQEALHFLNTTGAALGSNFRLNAQSASGDAYVGGAGEALSARVYPSNLYADLANATAIDVNTVRRAFALQRYEEARARYGSRYTEYLRYLGVRSSDSRLQRPEYLGGGKQTIAFTEVLQTAPTTDGDPDGVANLKGHGIAAARSRRFVRFFEEHGLVLSLMSVRPRTIYANGLPRMFSRATKEDFWQKELEHIGQQEVLNKEVYVGAASPDGTFGYQDRYAEYRHIQSTIAGEFRDAALNFWHMARIFGAEPALNSSFVSCDPTNRIYQSTATDQLYVMAAHSIQARRMVTRNPGGRIL